MLSFTTDRTGFPLIVIKALQLDVQLFPVTKHQFEIFLSEPNQFDDTWYESVLDLNPRWQGLPGDRVEQMFLTGILPTEAVKFAAWLGEGYRLPNFREWSTIYEYLGSVSLPVPDCGAAFGDVSAGAMRCIGALMQQEHTSALAQLARFEAGVMEWIQGRHGWQLVGKPDPSFGQQLFCCRAPVTPTSVEKRNKLRGFRLVRDRVDG